MSPPRARQNRCTRLAIVHARRGDVTRARKLHHELVPLFDVLFCETNPIPVKAACAALGLCDDEIRLPLTRLTAPNLERLKVILKDLGIQS